MDFVDLETEFDRVPRDVVWWALRYLGVDEWIVYGYKSDVRRCDNKAAVEWERKQCFQCYGGSASIQGSVLSPLGHNMRTARIKIPVDSQGGDWKEPREGTQF